MNYKNLFKNCVAVLISSPSNLFYFSSYQNDDARIVLFENERYYITDKRSLEEVESQLTGFITLEAERGDYTAAALNLLKKLDVKRVGIENETITHQEFLRVSESVEFISDSQSAINALRAVKTPEEIGKIKKAQKVTDWVFSEILNDIREGVSENFVKARISELIAKMGGELAFPSIVAFGKNTSKPHAHPSEYALRAGDPITLDFGAKLEGYCSDMTRSFVLSEPPKDYEKTYAAVLGAQQAALSFLRSGISGKEGDEIARSYLRERGLDDYFTHSLGHSFGVDIHESPNLSPRCTDKIPEGATLSVEPGVYFPDKFGIRIEDTVLFKINGVENLTNSPKQLIII